MFDFLSRLYFEAVYRPQLNLLQFLFNITGDIGVSIILLALIVNLFLLPFYASAYINTQKARVLQPLLADIRDKHKTEPAVMIQKTSEFNRTHGIRNSSLFWVLALQLIFATALWSLTQNVSQATESDGFVQLPGLYPFIFATDMTQISKIAFGFMNIGTPVNQHVWLPILTSLVSVFYGYYTFKLAPKPKIFPLKKGAKPVESDSPFDPEVMQKAIGFQTTFFFPVITFLINYNLTTGVNIYFFTLGIIALARQMGFSMYYTKRTDVLLERIIQSDPSLVDDNVYNNLQITAPGDITADNEVAELVIDPADALHPPVPVAKSTFTKANKPARKTKKNRKTK